MSEQAPFHEYPIDGHVCRGRAADLPASEPWRCYEGPLIAGDVWLIHPGTPEATR